MAGMGKIVNGINRLAMLMLGIGSLIRASSILARPMVGTAKIVSGSSRVALLTAGMGTNARETNTGMSMGATILNTSGTASIMSMGGMTNSVRGNRGPMAGSGILPVLLLIVQPIRHSLKPLIILLIPRGRAIPIIPPAPRVKLAHGPAITSLMLPGMPRCLKINPAQG